MSGVRRQLTGLVTATTSLVLVALLVPIALLLRSGAEQRAISAAALQAEQVAVLGPSLSASEIASASTTVFLPNGTVEGMDAPVTDAVRLARTGQSFVARSGGGVEVLVPSHLSAGFDQAAVVRVFVPGSELHRGVTRAWVMLAALGLVLLGLGLLLADRLGRAVTRPVGELAATADRLASGDLTARVVPGGPVEVREVGAELNRLADRITELLAAGREETADLAHRLRTPLTALRLDAEGLADPGEAARLSAGVRGLSERIDEVIRTARRPEREGIRAHGDLAAVAAARVAFWAVLAEDVGRALTVVLPETGQPLWVRASSEDVATALDALTDNALTHTPEGSPIRVTVAADADAGIRCAVEDGGPGLGDVTEVERGQSAAGSTGLGLDIAARTVRAAGGELRIGHSADLGGALVELRFGAAVRR